MADKKKSDKLDVAGGRPAPAKKQKASSGKKPGSGFFSRVGGFFVRIWQRLARWFKELRSESKKITWPSFKQVVNNTAVVLAVVAIVGTLIFVSDITFRTTLELFIHLF